MRRKQPIDAALVESDRRVRRVRNFVTGELLKALAAAVIAIVLLRVVSPGLINTHDDALGVLGLLSAVAAPVVLGWAAVSVFISTRRFVGEIGETK